MCFQLFLSVDPSLGRVNYSLMSDQTLMEMFIEGFDEDTENKYQDSEGMYLDVCDWSCTKCDDAERVIQAEMHSTDVSGSLDLCYIPPKMKGLKITSFGNSKLTGSIDLTHLPHGMQILALESHHLTGGSDLTQFPDEMKYLKLRNKQFTGEIDLTHLSDGMHTLNLKENEFTGEIDFAHLPDRMKYLTLSSNQFTGEIDLEHLPDRMEHLSLDDNQFTGEVNLTHISRKMKELHLQKNQLTGEVDLTHLPSGLPLSQQQPILGFTCHKEGTTVDGCNKCANEHLQRYCSGRFKH